MRRNISTGLAGIVCAAGLLLLGPDRPCYGQGLLPFTFDPNGPTFLGTNGSLSYDASTGEFQGTGLPLTLSSPLLPGSGFVRFSGNPQLSFDLFVNPDGTFRRDGAGFDLTGTLSIGATNISGTLLSGDFTAFGAEPRDRRHGRRTHCSTPLEGCSRSPSRWRTGPLCRRCSPPAEPRSGSTSSSRM